MKLEKFLINHESQPNSTILGEHFGLFFFDKGEKERSRRNLKTANQPTAKLNLAGNLISSTWKGKNKINL